MYLRLDDSVKTGVPDRIASIWFAMIILCFAPSYTAGKGRLLQTPAGPRECFRGCLGDVREFKRFYTETPPPKKTQLKKYANSQKRN
jgi:hypothetical protein